MTPHDKRFSILLAVAIAVAFGLHFPLNVIQASLCSFRLAQKLDKYFYGKSE